MSFTSWHRVIEDLTIRYQILIFRIILLLRDFNYRSNP